MPRSFSAQLKGSHLLLGVYMPLFLLAPLAAIAYSRAYLIVPSEALRIGINPWPGFEFATLADELGYFAEERINVSMIEFGSLSDSRRAFERGQVDGFFATICEAIEVQANSRRRCQIVMVVDYSNGADMIIGGPRVDSLPDLIGKKVGVDEGSLTRYVFHRAIAIHNLPADSIELVTFPLEKLVEKLELGEVDAIVSYSPFADQALNLPDSRVVFSSKALPEEIADVLVMDADRLPVLAEQLEGFKSAFFKAVLYYDHQPEKCLPIIALRERVEVDELRQMFAGIALVGSSRQHELLSKNSPLAESMGTLADVMYNLKRLDHRPQVELLLGQ
jgi:NitT/TauT family transport system substrate-binding protein